MARLWVSRSAKNKRIVNCGICPAQVMAYQSWKGGMDVKIMHQMQKMLPPIVLDSMPKAKPADSAVAPKRSAEAPPSEEGRSPVRARIAPEAKPAASASGVQGTLAHVEAGRSNHMNLASHRLRSSLFMNC